MNFEQKIEVMSNYLNLEVIKDDRINRSTIKIGTNGYQLFFEHNREYLWLYRSIKIGISIDNLNKEQLEQKCDQILKTIEDLELLQDNNWIPLESVL